MMKNTDNITALAAELARIDAQIAHLEWWITAAPAGINRQWAIIELTTRKGQDRGNVLVDLRLAGAAA